MLLLLLLLFKSEYVYDGQARDISVVGCNISFDYSDTYHEFCRGMLSVEQTKAEEVTFLWKLDL